MKNYIGLQAVGMGFDAHMTLLYTGLLSPVQEAKVQGILTSLGPRLKYKVFGMERKSIEMFGPNYDTPVITLHMREDLKDIRNELIAKGIPAPSEFTEWNPHITLKLNHPHTIEIPAIIRLVGLGLY